MSTAKAPAAPSGRICEKFANAQFYDKTLYVEHSINNIYL